MTRTGYAVLVAVIAALLAAACIYLLRGPSPVGDGPPRIDTLGMEAPSGTSDVLVDAPAPLFRLPTLEGDSLLMADLKGEVVVVNFWATWCAPCRIEIPDLIEMQEALRDHGVRFVGIALEADNVEAVRAFADDVAFNYTIALDDGDVADDFGGIYALPTTILIDRSGIVVRKIPGLVTRRSLLPMLEELAGV